MRVIGYTRVSTGGQAESGAGLAAQRAAISAEAERRSWDVNWVEDAGVSGNCRLRPGLASALEDLAAKRYDALVVSKLDRLSRSLQQFAELMDLSRRQRWAFVALDLGVDTTTPSGELVANLMASVSQWERRTIGERTREALAVKRASGVRLGRPRMTSPEIAARIMHMHEDGGETFSAIATALNREDVPTPNGGRAWYPSTVARIVARERMVL